MEARHLWALTLTLAVVVPAARGVWMDLPSGGEKCLSEQLHNNVVVLADYYSFYYSFNGDQDQVNNTVNPSISVKVSSPHGKELYLKENVTYGQFAFTTTNAGTYVACFWLSGDHQAGKSVTVGLEWKTGIATKDWDTIARKEKIEGLDLELRKLEDVVESIHEKMYQIMSKELKMSIVSETTNARVARYSAMSLGVSILVSALQLSYLRRYFRKKKLI